MLLPNVAAEVWLTSKKALQASAVYTAEMAMAAQSQDKLEYTAFISYSYEELSSHESSATHVVIQIATSLRESGFKIWADTSHLESHAAQISMSDGITNSNIFIICVTRSYMAKINSRGDSHSKFEYNIGLSKKSTANAILVVLEPEMLDLSNWEGRLIGHFSDTLYVDFSRPELLRHAQRELIKQILQRAPCWKPPEPEDPVYGTVTSRRRPSDIYSGVCQRVTETAQCKRKSHSGLFCDLHTCPWPGCKTGKSSKEPRCAQHHREAVQPNMPLTEANAKALVTSMQVGLNACG